jgi:7,8-dihydro-6-hydroxymethylpterin-pyrophosphokinase
VLRPIAEIAPHWRHPVLGETASDLLKRLEESN